MAQPTVMVSRRKILIPVPFVFSSLLSPFPFSSPLSLCHSLPSFTFSFPFPPSFSQFPFPFSFLLSLSLSPFSFIVLLSSFLLALSFSPVSFLLFLLLFLSLYTWNAVVTYRWRNPQLWFPPKKKSCCLSLSLSPFSFPSSFQCPFPFFLFPSHFPVPFPFLLSPFLLSPFPFSFPSPFSFLLSLSLSFSPLFPLQMERTGNL